jgi:hypothetical protein
MAHITYWKSRTRSARGERLPPENRLNINDGNRVVYLRWKRRSPKEVLVWHRQVQRDLLKALRAAPSAWFTRASRGPDWPFDLDGHPRTTASGTSSARCSRAEVSERSSRGRFRLRRFSTLGTAQKRG